MPFYRNRKFLIPTILWLVFVCIVIILLQTGGQKYYSLSRALIQWDGQNYLSIAQTGYEKYPCRNNPGNVCGNVGWFPLYPIVGRAISWTGIGTTWSLIILSWLALWGALLVLYRLVSEKYNDRVAVFSLGALLLFPTSFYYLTAFPYSLYLLLAVTILYLMEHKRYWPLIPLTGLLTVSYPSGLLIGLPLAYLLVAGWRDHSKSQRLALTTALVSIGIALSLYCGYYWLRFDDFFLYSHFQSQGGFNHSLSIPFVTLIKSYLSLELSDPTFMMLVLIPILLIAFYRRSVPVSWQLFMFGAMLFTPTFGTTMCYYRHVVIAFPLFVMIGLAADSAKRRYLLPLYGIASIILALEVYLFWYKAGQLM